MNTVGQSVKEIRIRDEAASSTSALLVFPVFFWKRYRQLLKELGQ